MINFVGRCVIGVLGNGVNVCIMVNVFKVMCLKGWCLKEWCIIWGN